jgi:hypothetical protein
MRALQTYSLIKALYDEGKDYIDAFWPILLQVMPIDGRPLAPGPMADEVLAKFALKIPVHTVQTLAERARRKHGYLLRDNKSYSLTEKGRAYVGGLETSRQVQRRIEALVVHACEVLKGKDPLFADREVTLTAMTRVIELNYHVFDFVSERAGQDRSGVEDLAEKHILEYFDHLEEENPTQFATLRDLILGSTLAGLLKRDDIADATRHFGPTQLYLDTNVILSLLGLPFEVECRPTTELFGLLSRGTQFQLIVFDFTIEELVALLRGYRDASNKYLPHVKVRTIYSSLRYRGISPGDIALLIGSLEERLGSLGVTIERTTVRLDQHTPPTGATEGRILSYKPEQDRRGQCHDLAAIAEIAHKRGRLEYKVERARVFFLTEDYRLSNYAFIERGHQKAGTISEVMPDRLLTNLLWLKNPESLESLPVSAVIAMHSRDLFIDRRVWDAFHRELEQAVESGAITEEAASILLYDGQVQNDLAALGPAGKGGVDSDWLLRRLDDARARQEATNALLLDQELRRVSREQAQRLADAEGLVVARLDEATATSASLERTLVATQRRGAQDWQRLIASEKSQAQKTARRIVSTIKVLGVIIMLGFSWRIRPTLIENWNVVAPYFSVLVWVIPTGVWMLGWRVNPGGAWTRIGDQISARLLAPRLARFDAALREPEVPASHPDDPG